MPPLESAEAGRRPTRLVVDRGAIKSNATIIKSQISPDTQLMAVVKANGYGHGAVESARSALAGGASWLGVATISEALELRSAEIGVPILVLGSSDPSEAAFAALNDISIGVGDSDQLRRLIQALEAAPPVSPLRVHLKIDTGMRRFGVQPGDAVGVAEMLQRHRLICLEGVYSHFSHSDAEAEDAIDDQLATFSSVIESMESRGVEVGIAHISNSAALLRNRYADFGMVRAGICLYGIPPSEHVELFEGMNGALEWRATVQHLISLAPGEGTGYGGTYVATEQASLALLPVGYADGYPRQLSNLGWAGFQGSQLPVRGRVSMDQCSVGIPSERVVGVGDEMVLLGNGSNGEPTPNQLAQLIGTIGYELVSRISSRVPREYISG